MLTAAAGETTAAERTSLVFTTAAVTLALFTVGLIALLFLPDARYSQEALRGYEGRFRFNGEVQVVQAPDGRRSQVYVFTRIEPDSPLARAGVRVGDVPLARHGDGTGAVHWALRDLEDGLPFELRVVSKTELFASNRAERLVRGAAGQRWP